MTKLNTIYTSYGEEFSTVVANTYAYNILNSYGIIPNSLIIASPYDKTANEDVGQHSLLITDSYGNPARLTYDIQCGNGLNYKDDHIQIDIDSKTIIDKDKQLVASLVNIIDNKTISYKDNKIYVVSDELEKSSAKTYGLVKCDDYTIKSKDGMLYVDTTLLDYASGNMPGIAKGDGDTVISNHGVISVNTQNLQKGSSVKPGILKTDNVTTYSENGVISVKREVIESMSTESGHKLIKIDNDTIKSDNGKLHINEDSIPYASTTTYGKVKIDNSSLYIDNNGKLHPRNTDFAMSYIYDYNEALDIIEERIDHINELLNQSIHVNAPEIYSMTCNETTTTALAIPEYREEPINMPIQHVSVSINIITNTDFNISLQYDSNEPPVVELQDINYNNEIKKAGVAALDFTWPSTGMQEKELILVFDAKNFYAENFGKTLCTKIIITAAPVNDTNARKEIVYSIIRYNSKYKDEEETEIEAVQEDKHYKEVYDESFWFVTDNNDNIIYYENIKNITTKYHNEIFQTYNLPESAKSKNYIDIDNVINAEATYIHYYGKYEDENGNKYSFIEEIDKDYVRSFYSESVDGNTPIFTRTIMHTVEDEELYYVIKCESLPKHNVISNNLVSLYPGIPAELKIYQIDVDNEIAYSAYYIKDNKFYVGDPVQIQESRDYYREIKINGITTNNTNYIDVDNFKLTTNNSKDSILITYSTGCTDTYQQDMYIITAELTSNDDEDTIDEDTIKNPRNSKKITLSYTPYDYTVDVNYGSAIYNGESLNVSMDIKYSNGIDYINLSSIDRTSSLPLYIKFNVSDQDYNYTVYTDDVDNVDNHYIDNTNKISFSISAPPINTISYFIYTNNENYCKEVYSDSITYTVSENPVLLSDVVYAYTYLDDVSGDNYISVNIKNSSDNSKEYQYKGFSYNEIDQIVLNAYRNNNDVAIPELSPSLNHNEIIFTKSDNSGITTHIGTCSNINNLNDNNSFDFYTSDSISIDDYVQNGNDLTYTIDIQNEVVCAYNKDENDNISNSVMYYCPDPYIALNNYIRIHPTYIFGSYNGTQFGVGFIDAEIDSSYFDIIINNESTFTYSMINYTGTEPDILYECFFMSKQSLPSYTILGYNLDNLIEIHPDNIEYNSGSYSMLLNTTSYGSINSDTFTIGTSYTCHYYGYDSNISNIVVEQSHIFRESDKIKITFDNSGHLNQITACSYDNARATQEHTFIIYEENGNPVPVCEDITDVINELCALPIYMVYNEQKSTLLMNVSSNLDNTLYQLVKAFYIYDDDERSDSIIYDTLSLEWKSDLDIKTTHLNHIRIKFFDDISGDYEVLSGKTICKILPNLNEIGKVLTNRRINKNVYNLQYDYTGYPYKFFSPYNWELKCVNLTDTNKGNTSEALNDEIGVSINYYFYKVTMGIQQKVYIHIIDVPLLENDNLIYDDYHTHNNNGGNLDEYINNYGYDDIILPEINMQGVINLPISKLRLSDSSIFKEFTPTYTHYKIAQQVSNDILDINLGTYSYIFNNINNFNNLGTHNQDINIGNLNQITTLLHGTSSNAEYWWKDVSYDSTNKVTEYKLAYVKYTYANSNDSHPSHYHIENIEYNISTERIENAEIKTI